MLLYIFSGPFGTEFVALTRERGGRGSTFRLGRLDLMLEGIRSCVGVSRSDGCNSGALCTDSKEVFCCVFVSTVNSCPLDKR